MHTFTYTFILSHENKSMNLKLMHTELTHKISYCFLISTENNSDFDKELSTVHKSVTLNVVFTNLARTV